MTSTESFPEQVPEVADAPHVITEYSKYRIEAHVQQGMSVRDANIAVAHQSIHDPEFMESARNLEAYRARILEEPYGISAEIFRDFITSNPGQVLADAKNWASIRKQLGSVSTS